MSELIRSFLHEYGAWVLLLLFVFMLVVGVLRKLVAALVSVVFLVGLLAVALWVYNGSLQPPAELSAFSPEKVVTYLTESVGTEYKVDKKGNYELKRGSVTLKGNVKNQGARLAWGDHARYIKLGVVEKTILDKAFAGQ